MRKFTKAKGSAFRQPRPEHIRAARLELEFTVEKAAGIIGRDSKWWLARESGERLMDPIIFWAWRYWARTKDAPPIGEWRLHPDMGMHSLLDPEQGEDDAAAAA